MRRDLAPDIRGVNLPALPRFYCEDPNAWEFLATMIDSDPVEPDYAHALSVAVDARLSREPPYTPERYSYAAPFRALFRVLRAAHVDVPEEELGDGVSTFADLAGRSGGYSCGRYVGKWAPRWFLVQRLPAGAFLPSYPDQQLNTPIPARNLVTKGIDP